MRLKFLPGLFFCFLLICFNGYCQECSLTAQEESAVLKAFKEDSLFARWVKNPTNAVSLYEQYKANVFSADSLWNSDQGRQQKIKDFGYTNKFEFVPLVESLNGNNKFRKGMGVSYLIRTDSSTILFDMGWDDYPEMCALGYNLDMLGIDITDISIIVISHNHGDHQNEWKWITDKTFLNSANENILPSIKIYVPEDTLRLPVKTIYSSDPVKISEGVYTTGVIRAPFFFLPTREQSLIFNVKEKGIIIVTGCGHHSIEKLLLRLDKLTDAPVYGVLGGMHFPIDGESEPYMGYFISGKLPWEKFTLANVNQKIELLKKRDIKLIGVSTHDSSESGIKAFKAAFSDVYKDLIPGEWVVIK